LVGGEDDGKFAKTPLWVVEPVVGCGLGLLGRARERRDGRRGGLRPREERRESSLSFSIFWFLFLISKPNFKLF
jgi:hypothetical protein